LVVWALVVFWFFIMVESTEGRQSHYNRERGDNSLTKARKSHPFSWMIPKKAIPFERFHGPS